MVQHIWALFKKEVTMGTKGYLYKPLVFPITLAVGALLVMGGMVTSAIQAAEPTKKIEIVAKDNGWKVSGYTIKDELTEVVVRNEDTTTHGFNSSLFKDVTVK